LKVQQGIEGARTRARACVLFSRKHFLAYSGPLCTCTLVFGKGNRQTRTRRSFGNRARTCTIITSVALPAHSHVRLSGIVARSLWPHGPPVNSSQPKIQSPPLLQAAANSGSPPVPRAKSHDRLLLERIWRECFCSCVCASTGRRRKTNISPRARRCCPHFARV